MHIHMNFLRFIIATCVTAIATATSQTSLTTTLDPNKTNATTSSTTTTTTTTTSSNQQQVTSTFSQIKYHHDHHQHNNQISQHVGGSTNVGIGASSSKKSAHVWQNQNLNKFQKYLSEHQQELVQDNPGSLWAVARAVKMAIKECQYQMRNEPWDCPIYGFSVRASETFGMLMTRSFKQTSFIQALLSSAITHSVARACTESIITTCTRKQLPHGKGFGENIEFGEEFARDFLNETLNERKKLQLQQQQQQQRQHQNQQLQELTQEDPRIIDNNNNNNNKNDNLISMSNKAANSLISPNSIVSGNGDEPPMPIYHHHNSIMKRHHQRRQVASAGVAGGGGGYQREGSPVWKEKRLRKEIIEHNEKLGRRVVFNSMRRECKCHGISGACSMHTCWDRLPPFRDVAVKLHDYLDKALRVEMYVAPIGSSMSTNRHKSLTSESFKKSNKKRSSSPANPLSGFGRSAVEATAFGSETTPSYGGDTAGSFTSGRCEGGRLQGQCGPMSSIDSVSNDNGIGASNSGISTDGNTNYPGENDTGIGQSAREFAQNTVKYSSLLASLSSSSSQTKPYQTTTNMTTIVKKRPIARSIGLPASAFVPGGLDLLYVEQSPDFCLPNERYNIKGTRGRVCSENSLAPNSCESLCCGRGYRTEIREEKYTCDCKFELCCNLKCNTCKRQKVVHKCL